MNAPLNGPGGALGFPTSDVTTVQQNGVQIGYSAHFAGNVCVSADSSNGGSAIYYGNSVGTAYEVQGCIYYKYWHDLGGPGGALGFPISDETACGVASAGDRISYFQGGSIAWVHDTGQLVVRLSSSTLPSYCGDNNPPGTFSDPPPHTVAGDFTGDGKSDIVSFYNYGNGQTRAWLFRWTASGSWSTISMVWDSGVNFWNWNGVTFVAGDFTGDGKTDIMAMYNEGGARTTFWLFQGTATGIAPPVRVWDSGAGNFDWNRAKFVAGDFNGDGKADIVAFYNYGNAQTKAWLWPGTSASTWSSVSTVWDSGVGNFDWNQARFVAGDFTGDGRADVVAIYNYGNAQTKFWLFPGTSAPTWSGVSMVWDSGVGNFDWNQAKCAAGDYNEDGLADIVCFYNYGSAQTRAWLFRPTSTSWSVSLVWDSGVGNCDWNQARFFAGDFNGDGHIDIVCFYNYGSAQTKAWLFQATSTPWNVSLVWDSGPNDWDWNRM